MNEKNLEIKKISKPEKVYPKKEINSLDDMAVSSDEVSKEIESLDNPRFRLRVTILYNNRST